MQILEIVIYSRDGRRRVLPFRPGKVNIVTGRQHTGKSSLIYIVSYCMGGSNCVIPEGRILEASSWFGLLLDCGSERIFVARENAYPGHQSTNRAYVLRGADIASPNEAPTAPNTTSEAVETILTQVVGISANLHVPPNGQTRQPLTANIRHALFYCFQHQTEIGTNQILFHRQSEDHITQTIKDTLPYFLGAVREDHLALVQEITRLRRELRQFEQRQRESESIRGEGLSNATALYEEAKSIGLLADSVAPGDLTEIRGLLTQVENWQPDQATFSGSDLVVGLQDELSVLERRRQEAVDRIRTAKAFAQEAEGYSTEARIQASRLESIGLFHSDHDSATCPLCQQHMDAPTPTASAIESSLRDLSASLDTVTREQPRLREYIDGLENGLSEVVRQKIEKQEALNGLLRQQDAALRLRDLNVRRGMVIGRISLWLQSVPETQPDSSLSESIAAARSRLAQLEAQASSEEEEERLTSMLNRINAQITTYAKGLDLEFSENPVRLDMSAATVVIDRPDRPVALRRLGSGGNWVGYHIAVHLALHKHFRTLDRPVPGFLFLDQPTQAFFPADRDAEMKGDLTALPRDDDREQVASIFRLISDFVQELAPGMQVIVTDHADLSDAHFQGAVVERWRTPDAGLIPLDWPSI